MSNFAVKLEEKLQTIREAGLYRSLRRLDSPQTSRIELEGRQCLNFSSNDYLGLADHPALKEAAIKAIEKFGAGSGASRLICGSLGPHHELDDALARFKGTGAALSFSSGYAAAVGTITALLDKNDVLVLDKLVHASIVDAARLSGAKLRVFAHNDLNSLEHILQWAERERSGGTVLVVVESVYSMDGDLAPLRDLVGLKERFGAWLMVDEAHGTGVFGANRRGVAEQEGVAEAIEIQMGTLGKAIGAAGGYICGSKALIDLLVNRARSFIFSTAPVPAAAAAAVEGVRLVSREEGEKRKQLLWHNVRRVTEALPGLSSSSAIIPIMIGDEKQAMEMAESLRGEGVFIPAVRYPTVARGEARLTLTLSANHTENHIAELLRALKAQNVVFKFGQAGSMRSPKKGS